MLDYIGTIQYESTWLQVDRYKKNTWAEFKAKKEELEQENKWILGKKVHIVVDEVAIKPDEGYLPNVDKFVGHVDMARVL